MIEVNTNCPDIIKKRNGSPVPFDVTKIRAAIRKANDAAQVEAIAPYQFEKLVEEVIKKIPEGKVSAGDKLLLCLLIEPSINFQLAS